MYVLLLCVPSDLKTVIKILPLKTWCQKVRLTSWSKLENCDYALPSKTSEPLNLYRKQDTQRRELETI